MKATVISGASRQRDVQPARYFITAAALSAAILAGGCGRNEPGKEAAAPPPPVVEVTDAVQRDVPVHQEWVGTLDGMVNARILAQVTGRGSSGKSDSPLSEISALLTDPERG